MVSQAESGQLPDTWMIHPSGSLSPCKVQELLTWGWIHKLFRVLAEQSVLNVASTHPAGSCVGEKEASSLSLR